MIRTTIFLLGLVIFASGILCHAGDDFSWSWQDVELAQADTADTEALDVPEAETFEWSWEEPGEKQPKADKPTEPDVEPVERGTAAGKVDIDEYNELLQENLRLRKQLANAARDEEEVRREKTQLARQVSDLEARISQFTSRIQELKKEKEEALAKTGTDESERVAELQDKLTEAEREKTELATELQALRTSQQEPPDAEVDIPATAVAPDSDLFRQVEAENARLKERLAQIQSERQELSEISASAQDDQEELRRQLMEAKQAEKAQREALSQALEQIPELEQDLTSLQRDLQEKNSNIEARQRALESMQAELERREQRLLKAERIMELMERTRSELQWRNDREKRDMHYNMAAVYAREGRYRAAEKEYLSALRIDPTDADTHYNLGILYEEALQDPNRAAMHYRKYVRLKPTARDIDTVRLWLMELDTVQ